MGRVKPVVVTALALALTATVTPRTSADAGSGGDSEPVEPVIYTVSNVWNRVPEVWALDGSGAHLWTWQHTELEVNTSNNPEVNEVAVSPDGHIYVGSDGGYLSKLTPQGAVVWTVSTGPFVQAIAVDGENNVYASLGLRGDIARFDPDGNELWRRDDHTDDRAVSLAADSRGNVYSALWDGRVIRLDAATGDLLGVVTEDGFPESVAVDEQGLVYVGTDGFRTPSEIRRYTAAGELLWTQEAGGSFVDLVVDACHVYGTRSEGGELYKLDRDTGAHVAGWPVYAWYSNAVGLDAQQNTYVRDGFDTVKLEALGIETWRTPVEGEGFSVDVAPGRYQISQAGAPCVRDHITRLTEELFGERLSSGYAGDPVNTATGNLTETWVDLTFAEQIFGLLAARTYNSQDGSSGLLGRGWSTPYESSVAPADDGSIRLVDHDGRHVRFEPDGEGGWNEPEELFGQLQEGPDGRYVIEYNSGERWVFDEAGQLESIGSPDGPSVSIERDAAGRPRTAESSLGPELIFAYEGDRLVELSAGDGRRVNFRYDAAGDLTAVTGPDGGTERYTVDAEGRVARIVDAAGRLIVDSTYDELGRVIEQRTAAGDEVSFAYDESTGATTVSAASGNTVVFHHDRSGRLISVADPFGAVHEREYDAVGNLRRVVDRLGATSDVDYDARGNVVAIRHADGTQEALEHDELSRLTRHVDAHGSPTTYRYVDQSRIPSEVVDAEGAVTVLESASGIVTSVTDADGVRVSLEHDEAGNIAEVTDGLGNTTRFGHDPAGRLVSAVSPLGHETMTVYDDAGRVVEQVDANGAGWSFTYDSAGNLTEEVDPLGATTRHAYDDAGLRSSTTDPRGESTTFVYDVQSRLLREEAPGGAVTSYEYGPLGRLEQVTDPVGATTSYRYDANGGITEIVDAEGWSATSTYDDRGRVTRRADREGGVARYEYDAAGRLLAEIDPTGLVTSYEYDRVGRVVGVTEPRGGASTYTYTAAGRRSARTDATGRTERWEYDAAGRLIHESDAVGAATTYEYDDDGRLVQVASPEGRQVRFQLDPVGRVLERTSGDGTETFRYDAVGRLVQVTDPVGGERAYRYDPGGLITEAVDPLGGVTTLTHDARRNLLTRTNQLGNTERWAYDLGDRLTSATDGLGRTTTLSYDRLGRLIRVDDPSGRSERFGYDRAGRLLTQHFDDGSHVAHSYDAAGRRIQMVDPSGSTVYGYDGDLLATVDATSGTWSYEHDAGGRRTSMTPPGGQPTDYGYDEAGRLSQLRHPQLGEVDYEYDADGLLIAERLPDGARTYERDAQGRVIGYVQELAGADRRTRFTREPDGRVTQEITDDVTVDYAYDAAGQLIRVASSDPRPVPVHPLLEPTCPPDLLGILCPAAGTTTTEFEYDAVGSRVESRTAAGASAFTYDAAGQLVSLSTPSGDVTYTYDGAGRRVLEQTDSSSVETEYGAQALPTRMQTIVDGTLVEEQRRVYDGDGVLVGVTSVDSDGGAREHRLEWDVARDVRRVVGVTTDDQHREVLHGHAVTAYIDGSTARSFSLDAHGSVIKVGADDELAAADGYDAFGVPTTSLSESVSFGYRGEMHVGDRIHLRARDYDPITAGFLTRDPLDGVLGEVTVANPYHYAANDPINRTDPLGLSPFTDDAVSRTRFRLGERTVTLDELSSIVGRYALLRAAPPRSRIVPEHIEPRCGFLYGACSQIGLDVARGFSNFSAGIFDRLAIGTVNILPKVDIAPIGPLYSDRNYLPSYTVGSGTGVVTEVLGGAKAGVGAYRYVRSAGGIRSAARQLAAGARSASSNVRSFWTSIGRRASDAPEAAGAARATVHGAERLAQAGFTDDVVRMTKTDGINFAQADGAQVFLREVTPGRFDFIVQGERGVITAHRGWSTKSVERLARNYGWDWP